MKFLLLIPLELCKKYLGTEKHHLQFIPSYKYSLTSAEIYQETHGITDFYSVSAMETTLWSFPHSST